MVCWWVRYNVSHCVVVACLDMLQDLGTQVHHWDAFQCHMKTRGLNKRAVDELKFVPPYLGEYMAGYLIAFKI